MFKLVFMDEAAITGGGPGRLINLLDCGRCDDDLDLHERLVVEVEIKQKVVDGEEIKEVKDWRVVACDRKPRTWQMWARRQEKVIAGREFLNFGHETHVRRVTQIGEPVAVELTEDPDGIYWGWIACHHRDGYGGVPALIQPHPGGFRMQFTYGPDKEQELGRGEIVRMSAKAVS